MLALTLTYVLTNVKPCADMGVLDNGETQMTAVTAREIAELAFCAEDHPLL